MGKGGMKGNVGKGGEISGEWIREDENRKYRSRETKKRRIGKEG